VATRADRDEELQDALGRCVGLGEHRGAGLDQDLLLGVVGHLGSHVGVTHSGLRSGQVLLGDRQVGDGVLQTVLESTELATLVYSSDEIQVPKWMARNNPETRPSSRSPISPYPPFFMTIPASPPTSNPTTTHETLSANSMIRPPSPGARSIGRRRSCSLPA